MMRQLAVAATSIVLLAACGKHEEKVAAQAPVEVTVTTVAPRDTPVTYDFVGQTQSSHQVEIRARVAGFLDRRVYREGAMVKAGELMFLQDPKPFEAQLAAAKGALAEQQARLQTANDNLAQTKPLVSLSALSQKDLDDATGQQLAAAAAVETAKANLDTARLNLSYTRITTPISGLSSSARVQDGGYVNVQNSLLTYVDQINPIWVNFSVSENEMLGIRDEQAQGRLRMPSGESYEVEVVLADGSVFPHKGKITFANASYNPQTGTFQVRATHPNPEGALRPGQFVRVRLSGIVRLNAILVPQQSVLQGAKGHFVVIVDKDQKAQIRPVQVGPWFGDEWFITDGLKAGETVITDGAARVTPGAAVRMAQAPAPDTKQAAGSVPATK
jgi:membrane fusion protein (multidrug efflux system)